MWPTFSSTNKVLYCYPEAWAKAYVILIDKILKLKFERDLFNESSMKQFEIVHVNIHDDMKFGLDDDVEFAIEGANIRGAVVEGRIEEK